VVDEHDPVRVELLQLVAYRLHRVGVPDLAGGLDAGPLQGLESRLEPLPRGLPGGVDVAELELQAAVDELRGDDVDAAGALALSAPDLLDHAVEGLPVQGLGRQQQDIAHARCLPVFARRQPGNPDDRDIK
jgi:hypothetical protein